MSVLDQDLAPEVARTWIARWDRQQEGYVPDREERFTAMIDAIEVGTGRLDPVVLDLGCGPGSLAVRLLDRLPQARVIAIDTDPLLLALAQSAAGDRPGLSFHDLDLRTSGWSAKLGLDRPVDAAMSTTALHWLPEPELKAMYAEVASILRPGGLLLNGDGMHSDDTVLDRIGRALVDRAKDRVFGADRPEDWTTFWQAVEADPHLAALNARRATIDHSGNETGQVAQHVNALREAGFREVETIWQRGHNRVLCAIR